MSLHTLAEAALFRGLVYGRHSLVECLYGRWDAFAPARITHGTLLLQDCTGPPPRASTRGFSVIPKWSYSERGRFTFMGCFVTGAPIFFFLVLDKKKRRACRWHFAEDTRDSGPSGERLIRRGLCVHGASRREPRGQIGTAAHRRKSLAGASQLKYEERVYRLLSGGVGIPNVVDYFTDRDYNILVMQRMGKSLEDVLEEQGGTLSSKTVLALGVRLLQALQHIHNKGMIHRDLKPQNMMLSTDSQCVPDRFRSFRALDPSLSRGTEEG